MENLKILSFKNIITFLIIVALLVIAFYSIDILMMLFGAFIITCAINPLINKMEKRIPRVWAVTLVLLALIIASFVIIVPLITISIREAINLADNFPSTLVIFDKISNFQIFNHHLGDFITLDAIKDNILEGTQSIIKNSINIGKIVVGFLTALFAIMIMVFYFAYDEKRLKDKFIEFFPVDKKQKALKIFENIASRVGNYVFAQGIAMFFVGLVTTVGLLILHNEHAFLLGFITGIFDIVPVVGPAVAILIGLISSSSGGFVYVLLTFIVYIFAQWTQNQFLRPIVFGKLLNIHPLIIIVALLASARFLGFWGVVLAPALACVICVLVDELYLNEINNK